MRTDDFDYHLPPDLIAQTPVEPRDASRLLVFDRVSSKVSHRMFVDILDYLKPGDVMVFNQSRVIQARIRGRRADTGGKVEFLLLNEREPGLWRALAQPGRRLRPGARVVLDPPHRLRGPRGLGSSESEDPVHGEVLESHPDGTKTVRLPPDAALDSWGEAPLPPYIHQRLDDPERYQTVYAKDPGSAAAPTAGLHFTVELIDRIQRKGVELAFVTLHVGLDTFRPVTSEDPAAHHIHTEYYQVGPEAANTINLARERGGRVFAVGTTSVRVLEQAASQAGFLKSNRLDACAGWADIFILPGHRFRLVDAMITNFHLPRSTLLMLVSAFAEQPQTTNSGLSAILAVYQEAIAERYRFYSFGDAMLLL